MLSAIKSSAASLAPGDVSRQIAEFTQGSKTYVAQMRTRVRTPQGNPRQQAAAKAYMAARLRNDTRAAVALVSPNIKFYSQRDGLMTGVQAFEAYLNRTPPEGTWKEPVMDPETGMIRFDGSVKWAKVIPVTVKGLFICSPEGVIEEIFVGKA